MNSERLKACKRLLIGAAIKLFQSRGGWRKHRLFCKASEKGELSGGRFGNKKWYKKMNGTRKTAQESGGPAETIEGVSVAWHDRAQGRAWAQSKRIAVR